jgi:hypothetical protein
MEDRGLSLDLGIAEGVNILRASAKYGVAMFPEDGGEWGEGPSGRKGSPARKEEMGAADVILMERAMRRRRELALEEGDEEVEDMLLNKAAQKERKSEETKGRKRRLGRAKGSEMDVSDAPEVAKPKPLPRPRPVRILNPLTGSPPTSSHEPSKTTDGASDAEIGVERIEPCAAEHRSKSQRPIMRYGTPIELDSSDSVEVTDSSYSAASPSKRRRTKAKGKHKDTTTKVDAGNHIKENFLHPTSQTIDPDMTPRRPVATFATEPVRTQGPFNNNLPGPSNINFYPLKAARARKCNDST